MRPDARPSTIVDTNPYGAAAMARAAWTPKPGASAAWTNAAGLLLYPTYGSWAIRYPDGSERWFYTLAAAMIVAARYVP